MRRSADVVRGMAALALLAGLVVGVPILLWVWAGWPLPSSVPSWAGISEAWADRYVPDTVWLSALAVVAWVAWAWLTAAVVVEVLAVARERVATRVPLAGPLQSWAHRLVGTAALVTSLLGTRPAFAEPAPLPPPPAVAVVGADAPDLAPAFATANAAAPSSTALPTYTVERRDDLWSIAEEHLGDPYRWQEVFDLNVGCPQADGGCLEEPDLIQPGWVFELPADATGLAPAPPPPPLPPPTAASPRVETPEAPVDATVGQDSAATRAGPLGPAAAMRGEGPPPSTTTTVTSAPQPEPQALPTPEPGQELPSRGSAPAPARGSADPAPAAANVGDKAGSTTTAVLAGSGLAAAGVVLVLNRLRRVQQRRRRPGRRIRMPDAELLETERSLRVGADEVGAELLDVVLRSMAEAAGQLDQALPDVVAVELDPSSLRVTFAAPPPSPPEPWEADPGERLWQLQLDDMDLDELRTLPGRIAAPLPALVSLGNRDGTQVLVNLEGTGVTEIVADAGQAEEVLAALALELTTCPWGDAVDVVLVGFGEEIEWLERARRAESLGDVVAVLEHDAYRLAALLDSSGWPNVVSARVQAAGDCVPTVVLCSTGLDDDVEERLAKLSGEVRHAGVTVVVAGEVAEAQRRLVVEGDSVRVEPLGLRARRERWLDADQLQAVAALLEVAGDTNDVAPGDSGLDLFFEASEEPVEPDVDWPSSDSDWSTPGQPVPSEPGGEALDAREQAGRVLNGLVYEDARVPDAVGLSDQSNGLSKGTRPSSAVPSRAEHLVDLGEEAEVEVRVLGPVQVVGRGPVKRAKSFEAVVYLAMHRDGVDSDKARWALWPEGSKQRSTWDTTVSVARTWLGEANGVLLLPKTYHNRGVYRLEDLISTDYERFGAAVALAKRLDGPPAVALLRSALERVRGPLFDGEGCKWEWPSYEGHKAALEAQVVDAVLRMSDLCLEAGDVEGATWAAHRGQRVSPYDERFTRILMSAADLAGNPAGVDAAMHDILEKVEADIEPFDQVHPDTLALYKELSRSRKTLAGSGRRR